MVAARRRYYKGPLIHGPWGCPTSTLQASVCRLVGLTLRVLWVFWLFMFRLRVILPSLLALGFVQSVANASLVWRPGEGWSDESGGDISASSSRDQLETAHKLEAQGQRDDAIKAYKSLLRRWPLSFFAPEAQFRLGKIEEDEADYPNAFKSFQTMVKKYPSSDYFEQALGEQYRIANLYLAGEPQRVWKIPVGPSMDKTVDMYNQIIKNAPYGTYAAQCEFKIGLAREQQRKYTDAVDAYQKVLDDYPTSAVASNAQYQIGYAWMRAASSANNDQSAAQKAIEAFQDFLVRYPNSDKAAQAQDNIQKLGKEQTQGAYNIAKFYEQQKDTRAAYIYYNEVVREDPNSPQAQLAKRRIQELRPMVEAMPGGAGPDGTPLAVATPATAGGAPDASGSLPLNTSSTDLPGSNVPGSGSLPSSASSAPPAIDPLKTPGPTTENSGTDSALPDPGTAAPTSTTNAAPAAPLPQ
jgi:outer membrane protein assembly factor BamD